jgi:hypothetical protein
VRAKANGIYAGKGPPRFDRYCRDPRDESSGASASLPSPRRSASAAGSAALMHDRSGAEPIQGRLAGVGAICLPARGDGARQSDHAQAALTGVSRKGVSQFGLRCLPPQTWSRE